MIIQTQLVAAVRCHECGRVLSHPVSLVNLGPGASEAIRCSCGSESIYLGKRRASAELSLRLPCPICGRTHFLTVPICSLLHGELCSLSCPVTLLELGYIGGAQEIVSVVEEWEDRLEEELLEDWAEFFDHPDVMYDLLDRLHTLAEADELRCKCGSPEIEMEIFPDRVELRCNRCGREDTLLAVDDEDLLRVQTLEVLKHRK